MKVAFRSAKVAVLGTRLAVDGRWYTGEWGVVAWRLAQALWAGPLLSRRNYVGPESRKVGSAHSLGIG